MVKRRVKPIPRKSTDAEEPVTDSLFTLLFKNLDPFMVIKVQTHTVFIEEDGVRNFDTIDVVTFTRSSLTTSTSSSDRQESRMIPKYANRNERSTTEKRAIYYELQLASKERIDTGPSKEKFPTTDCSQEGKEVAPYRCPNDQI